jgi:hypothetical protein
MHRHSTLRRALGVAAPALIATVVPSRTRPAMLYAQTTSAAAPSTPSSAAPPYDTRRDDPFYPLSRMDWPGPNRYRSSTGAPGPDYWQQRADYTIAAILDTGTQSLSGVVRMTYTNNSPDTLRFVWVQLDQNLYHPGSEGSMLFAASSRWGARDFAGGYELASVMVDGVSVAPKVDDTMARLDLPTPLPPHGGKVTIAIQYSFHVPDHGSDRMGRDSVLYEFAQWYPRMAVYDDVRGWNPDQYLGQGEFYLEYGDIDYSVTVPAGYTVGGSGVLQNARNVLSPSARARLERAATSTDVVAVITDSEARANKVTPRSGTATWHFSAKNVRDVAWAAAPDFRWDATSTGAIPGNSAGVLCQAYYEEPKAGKAWEAGAEQTQWTIRQYSQLFYPFPYPQATSVAGPVGGMEYPMFVMVGYGKDDPKGIFGVMNHEHGHEWFPMIVGSNERRYAWMDEGFNTYINAFALEARTPGMSAWPGYMASWKGVVDHHIASPIMTRPDHIDARALGAVGYRQPGAVLLALRDHVIGAATFDRAFREYIRRWAYKHPTPADFFRTIENVSGQDLAWFWRSFFYESDVLDIGIDSVTTHEGRAVIALHKMTTIPFPVTLRLALSDGSTQDVAFPVDIWALGDHYDAVVVVHAQVTGARLWPDGFVPDWNASNDTWGSAPPGTNSATTPATTSGLPLPGPTARFRG